MDLRPWDYWDAARKPQRRDDRGARDPRARVDAVDPKHPLAHHLWIHLVEASAEPAARLAVRRRAQRPRARRGAPRPHARAHLRARRALEGRRARQRARHRGGHVVREDAPAPGLLRALHGAQPPLPRVGLDDAGAESEARAATAREMVAAIPPEFLEEFAPIADGFMIFPSEVLMRFGRWEEILKEPEPKEVFPLSRALWRFTRAVALTALDRMDEAAAGARRLRRRRGEGARGGDVRQQPRARDLWPSPRRCSRARWRRSGSADEAAIAALEAAVKLEDALRYDEPPDWIQPVRHTLGAVLLAGGPVRRRRARLPRRPRALARERLGPLRALPRAPPPEQARRRARRRRTRSSARGPAATCTLTSSCLCQPTR